jgi:hypothetical protein
MPACFAVIAIFRIAVVLSRAMWPNPSNKAGKRKSVGLAAP